MNKLTVQIPVRHGGGVKDAVALGNVEVAQLDLFGDALEAADEGRPQPHHLQQETLEGGLVDVAALSHVEVVPEV